MKQTFKQFMEAGRVFSARTRKEVEPPAPAKPVGDAADFKIGQLVKDTVTGKEVKVLGYTDAGAIQVVSTDPKDLAINSWRDYSHKTLGGNLFSARGHFIRLPRELEAR